MDKNKLQDFKESGLTKEFFEILLRYREILKEDIVSVFETGQKVSRDDIANDLIYVNGYTQCLLDIVNINEEVINGIYEQHKEKIRPILSANQ